MSTAVSTRITFLSNLAHHGGAFASPITEALAEKFDERGFDVVQRETTYALRPPAPYDHRLLVIVDASKRFGTATLRVARTKTVIATIDIPALRAKAVGDNSKDRAAALDVALDAFVDTVLKALAELPVN